MAGLLDWVTEKAKQQYQQGLLNQVINDPASIGRELGQLFDPQYMSQVKPMTQEQALDVALSAPMMAGTIKPIAKTAFEDAMDLAQKNAALPVSKGGLGLPKNNTAMDRAKAMGFDTENMWLHGTRSDFPAFERTKDIGFHFGDKWQANDRAGKGSGSNVIPVFLKTKNPIYTDDVYGTNQNWQTQFHIRDKGYVSQDELMNMYNSTIPAKHDDAFRELLKNKGYDSAIYDNKVEGITTNLRNDGTKNLAKIVFNPNQIRSKFAAFDPFRRNEADILAGMAAVPVGLLTDNKRKEKKK